MRKEFLDRLPFPLDIAVFGTGLVVGAVVLTGVVSMATVTLKACALSDELKRVLNDLADLNSAKKVENAVDGPSTRDGRYHGVPTAGEHAIDDDYVGHPLG